MKIEKKYYPNKILKQEGYLVNGVKENLWTFYYKNGIKYREICYKDGLENGPWRMWHENGNLYIEDNMIDGKSNGEWKEYYENGALKEVGEHNNNIYIPKNFWDEHGNQLLKNGTGKKIEKFGASQIDVFEQHFENGKFIKEVRL